LLEVDIVYVFTVSIQNSIHCEANLKYTVIEDIVCNKLISSTLRHIKKICINGFFFIVRNQPALMFTVLADFVQLPLVVLADFVQSPLLDFCCIIKVYGLFLVFNFVGN